MAYKKSTRDYYAALLNGYESAHFPGIRSYVTGFTAADGYDLRRFGEWSKHKRAKVRRVFEQIQVLRAKSHIVLRPRRNDHLKIAQEAVHGELKVKGLKVAFVPYNPPKSDPDYRPEFRYDGNTLEMRGINYTKRIVPFDRFALAADTDRELERVRTEALDERNGSAHYTLQVGGYENAVISMDYGTFHERVTELMERYNGVDVPEWRMNEYERGKWNPRHHVATDWLTGVNVYRFGSRQRDSLFRHMREVERQRKAGKKPRKADRRKFLKLKRSQAKRTK